MSQSAVTMLLGIKIPPSRDASVIILALPSVAMPMTFVSYPTTPTTSLLRVLILQRTSLLTKPNSTSTATDTAILLVTASTLSKEITLLLSLVSTVATT